MVNKKRTYKINSTNFVLTEINEDDLLDMMDIKLGELVRRNMNLRLCWLCSKFQTSQVNTAGPCFKTTKGIKKGKECLNASLNGSFLLEALLLAHHFVGDVAISA